MTVVMRCQRMREFEVREPCAKRKYTRDEIVIERIDGLYAYRCDRCLWWHFTSSKPLRRVIDE